MDFGTLIYIAIIVVVVIANIYKGIKKTQEEQRQRREANANQPKQTYQSSTVQPQPHRPKPDLIPDPWQQPKAAPGQRKADNRPQPKRQKSIEEILAEMTRQPQAAKQEDLDNPYTQLDSPFSAIDRPTAVVGKDYKFDESANSRALSDKSYKNILEENDTLEDKSSDHSRHFIPREAFKYSTLLERKYEY
ncbi:hypothetical protein BH09BAC1_BH09BAC1_27830 [soil metagenome]